nr:immunoglobulin heavy chain junction region [Homo sapiens]
LSSVTAADTAV